MVGIGTQIFALLAIAVALWMLHRNITLQPELFKKQQLLQSMKTLGILALGLILFIYLLVLLLNAG